MNELWQIIADDKVGDEIKRLKGEIKRVRKQALEDVRKDHPDLQKKLDASLYEVEGIDGNYMRQYLGFETVGGLVYSMNNLGQSDGYQFNDCGRPLLNFGIPEVLIPKRYRT